MASPDKQQKRAQRAKAKAKQNRSGKGKPSVVHPVLNHAFVNEPFDDIAIDLSTFDFRDIMDNGFEPADYDDLFEAMKKAEAISLLAMCVVFLQFPVLEMVIAEEEEDPATDFLMALLITYRGIFHNEEEDDTVEWLGSDTFQDAYNEASDILQRKNARDAGRR
ncbi:hypothetical protein [Pseudomonas sp. LP_7_YM]|uniref:hypothetical protein n=1 Tax=Pseudomonas sp. LP_7_YM TaxID=2485137 RepID=UPI001060AC4C|nr:hypothetical protein [Pseudomonas sp. LP_7_YM]TDV64574.1 hypothetical protein EC915_105281 [Pseudomonas sp. LP_7_YM]